MLPASGGNLSGGCNSAGSSSYDLTSSGILLELNFFKVHFIGWSPNVHASNKETLQKKAKSVENSTWGFFSRGVPTQKSLKQSWSIMA